MTSSTRHQRQTQAVKRTPLTAERLQILWSLVVYGLALMVLSDILTTRNTGYSSSHNEFTQDSSDINHHTHDTGLHSRQYTTMCTRNSYCQDQPTSQRLQEAANQQQEPSSSTKKISNPETTSSLSSSSSNYLLRIFKRFNQNLADFLTHSLSGPRVLVAHALAPGSLYQSIGHDNNKIITLNSTNFDTELIQHNHPFPHLKLIEYYLPYCGICLKFKATYIQLAKEIFSWRNVIRLSAIDLGVSSNSPIAYSWSVDVVPTLRIHPPPNPSQASQLNKQLLSLSSKLSQSDLQKSMFEEYTQARLMTSSLAVFKYTNESKKETLPEKVALLKSDLLRYIEQFVREHPEDLPATWPNLKPVTETTLVELRKHHPRQELFLIIEASTSDLTKISDTDQSSLEPSPGLRIVMELSSSAAWKAVRYVRASENRALIEDVIEQKKKEAGVQVLDGQNSKNNSQNTDEQVKLLNNLLATEPSEGNNDNSIVLVHIDDSHSPFGQIATPQQFSFITIVTSSDLSAIEQSSRQHSGNRAGYINRAKRATDQQEAGVVRSRRSLFGSSESKFEQMSLQRRIELAVLFINHTHTETKEDREFVNALASLDENPTSHDVKRAAIERYKSSPTSNLALTPIKSTRDNNDANLLDTIIDHLNPFDSDDKNKLDSFSWLCNDHGASDYQDKLKAIKYILFTEVPRKSTITKSLVEQQEKLNTLMSLVTVIKTYFPLPDSSSVQFMDAVHSYITKQQSLLSSINTQDRSTTESVGFDTVAFKLELKRIESEGKRLPEIREWKHCKETGYPCALWRLFHTLTAFEYKKLNQINQQQSLVQLQQVSTNLLQSQENQSSLIEPARQVHDVNSSLLSSGSGGIGGSQNSLQSPVERLVSPPSTTTSLSLTIATPNSSSQGHLHAVSSQNNIYQNKQASEADLPVPVLLVMRDYVTNFFSCEDCAKKFQQESEDLSFERIRTQPAEFSILWLWETHNRVSKRLSVNPETNPSAHPKNWFPTYEQCPKCYRKPPSFLRDSNIEPSAIFHESIEWDKGETLNFLVAEFTRQPMDRSTNIFGYQVPYFLIIAASISLLLLIVFVRCGACYIERQRRHKASLLNGNGAHYSMELH